VWNDCLRTSRGVWCLRHAGALAWRRGPVCACTRVCWCRRIFTYIHIRIPNFVFHVSNELLNYGCGAAGGGMPCARSYGRGARDDAHRDGATAYLKTYPELVKLDYGLRVNLSVLFPQLRRNGHRASRRLRTTLLRVNPRCSSRWRDGSLKHAFSTDFARLLSTCIMS